jgi:DNA-directed RNA polymerase specialized sigma24 family protein
MEKVGDAAAAASGAEPRTGLRAVVALHRLAEALEALQVDNARAQGWSWQDIADALGVSKQAVHKKHAGRPSTIQPAGTDPAAPTTNRRD